MIPFTEKSLSGLVLVLNLPVLHAEIEITLNNFNHNLYFLLLHHLNVAMKLDLLSSFHC